jgi:hypothetical protein
MRVRLDGWQRKSVAAGVMVIVALAGYVAARELTSRYHDEQIRREMHAKAQGLKDEIDHRFPAGTTRAHFMEFADKWVGGVAKPATTITSL